METQGIIIWARSGSGALILWCADNGALVYVADRRLVGDRREALSVGDFVDFRVETVGAMRVGHDLRFRATGAGWVRRDLMREAASCLGPVMSPGQGMDKGVDFGPGVVREALAVRPANRLPRNGTGAA